MIYFGRSIDHHYTTTTTMTKTLEIHLRSAEGLKLNRRALKKKTLAVVSIGEKKRTSKPDESRVSNPTWNFKADMPINGNVQFIFIEVLYRTRSGQDKSVGKAKIPTSDFMGKYSPEGHLNCLSYRLRDEFGDKCGIVNFSILVKSDPKAVRDYDACSSQARDTGLWRPRSDTPSIDGYGGRIVTGVPVWGLYQRPY
ncbi:PREDICTED: BON1-associated protein 1-like [Camelina sativa]|uniref:BON1-associated protein 1-like n=1 Tax=Camelina sativa TaxID=90675 RepID=A0ABM0WCD3_CAMSA|nr:PREDICTED: BON1-associated protein 1-like [Camelina sativa]